MTQGVPGSSPRPKVAVVLGSGGLKACASIGLWKVLRRERIEVDMLVGCSGGSVYATLFARGVDIETATTLSRRHFTRKLISTLSYGGLLKGLFPRLFGFDESVALVSDRRLQAALRYICGDEATFDDCQTRLFLVATDIESGETVVLSEGRLRDAVRASISIPLLWRPWRVGDRLLFDGGASNPLPIDVAIREGAELIIAMGFENPKVRRVRSLIDLARQTSSIVQSKLMQTSFAFHNLAHHSEVIPVMPTFDRRVSLSSGGDTSYLIARGEEAAQEQVPYLRKLLGANGKAKT